MRISCWGIGELYLLLGQLWTRYHSDDYSRGGCDYTSYNQDPDLGLWMENQEPSSWELLPVEAGLTQQ